MERRSMTVHFIFSVLNQKAFDTVLMAIGRTANTGNLNLNRVGVKMNPHNDKVLDKKFT